MATTQIAIDRAPNRSGALPVVGATVIGLAAAALAAVGAGDREVAVVTAAAIVAAAWAALTVFLAARRPQERLWVWTGAGALVGAGALATNRVIGVVPFVALGIALALPTGALVTRFARVVLMIGAVIAVPAAAVIAASESPSTAFVVGEIGVLAALAVIGYVHRCRGASAIDRARLQWAGWGVVLAGALGLVIWLTHELIGWPDALGVPIVLGTLFVPLALALAATERVVLRIDRLLVRTIETGGLILLVGVIYLVVVLGFGDSPTDADHRVLGLSLVAAALAALCFVPARNRLEEFANRRVYGELPRARRAAAELRRAHVARHPARRAPVAVGGVVEEEHAARGVGSMDRHRRFARTGRGGAVSRDRADPLESRGGGGRRARSRARQCVGAGLACRAPRPAPRSDVASRAARALRRAARPHRLCARGRSTAVFRGRGAGHH